MVNAMMNELTNTEWTRPIGMSRSKQRGWKRVAIVAFLVCAAASARVAATPAISRPVAQFIHFYEQTDDLGMFDRVLLSFLMTTAPSS